MTNLESEAFPGRDGDQSPNPRSGAFDRRAHLSNAAGVCARVALASAQGR
jgi:hypothetical protein